ncbi:hypothetical protein M5W70_01855 [Paenibacillus larvae]|uniref:Uncharacterized protein n=1 Tax=Paenibacillus larvae TaxID=1464 RepID=A0AAP5JWG5_9BACL|nr:hypothetical protein [Paenibacillus larvae]MCY9687528.1 hypothetical protein [Paenibacillus larvae]MDT2252932.1 hypothetical protein [Paenibacillus larvae]MDV3485792.1 hypothetical protein [Paenibacillus larvae]
MVRLHFKIPLNQVRQGDYFSVFWLPDTDEAVQCLPFSQWLVRFPVTNRVSKRGYEPWVFVHGIYQYKRKLAVTKRTIAPSKYDEMISAPHNSSVI